MSETIREVGGVQAGDYQYTVARNGRINFHNNERNAIAWLLTIPWTVDLWSDGEGARLKDGFWHAVQTAALLLQAQAQIPNLSKAKLGSAIWTLAQLQAPTSPWAQAERQRRKEYDEKSRWP